MTSTIPFAASFDNGTFARLLPFDAREAIVRRGDRMGMDYGFTVSRWTANLKGGSFPLIRYRQLLSPSPGSEPPKLGEPNPYEPEGFVLFLPDAEVYLPLAPWDEGFTLEEVERILQAITVE